MRAFLLLPLLIVAACGREQAPETAPPNTPPPARTAQTPESDPAKSSAPVLSPLWISAGFSAPEGVALAPDGNYLISNVVGDGGAEDGLGWISKISPAGDVIAEKFIDGLDAPKGMAVLDGNLYVTDRVIVRIFDATTGEALDGAVIEGAKFLNDATVWQDNVFVADSGTGRIWRFTGVGVDLWREGEELSGVNGLLGVGDRMLITTMTSGSLFEATADGGWREIANGMTDADGVGVVPESAGGGYLVSSWPGAIHHVAPDGAVTKILDTRAEGILQNDLTIFGDVVIVPNWEPGTVTAWRIVAAD